MQSTFGAPRPLPGQRGHKQRESKKLETEARKMEQRLQALRADLNKSRMERENSGTNAGGGWRSARADRGGLKSYAKDARNRKPTRRTQPKTNGSSTATASSMSATASASMPTSAPAPAPAAPADPSSSSVSHWGVADVGAWLGRIGLERHAPTFASNEIDGPLLLELGLDDLDYMEVKVLAHRKALLKGVADLKRGGSGEVENHGGNANSSAGKDAAGKPKRAKGVHWSHVKPLSENAVTGGAPPVNLADGEFDERANRKEFLDALNEWRRGGGSGGPVRIVQDDGVGDGSVQVVDEAVADVGGGDGMWHNPADAANAAGTGTNTASGGSGGGLLQGELDEAKEHEDFVKAVNAWRTGSKPPPVVTKADGADGATSASTATSAEDKACCWLTFETFDKATGHFDKEVGQWFKNEHNAQVYREKQALEEAGRAQRREQLVRQQKLMLEEDTEAKGTAGAEAKIHDRGADEYEVDDEEDDDDEGFDADAYDIGRAQSKAHAPAATATARSPIQVKELSPDDKRWDEASDEDTPCCVVVEPDDAQAGADDSWQAAEAKQECTVQEYDKIRKMDVKF